VAPTGSQTIHENDKNELTDIARQVGVHVNMSDAQYFGLDALSSTTLRAMERSPAYAQMVGDQGPTDAMTFGGIVHAMVLDGELRWAPYEGKRNTKAGKEAYEQVLQTGRTPVRFSEWNRASECAASVLEHPAVAEMIAEAGDHREEAVVWERDGILCKAKKDARTGDTLWDLKTCPSVQRFSPWKIADELLHVQAAWYLDGEARAGLVPPRSWKWVAVASTPPFEVAVFEITEDAMRAGFLLADELFGMYRQCLAANKWPRHFLNLRPGDIPNRRNTFFG
jgi:hypothetical protein